MGVSATKSSVTGDQGRWRKGGRTCPKKQQEAASHLSPLLRVYRETAGKRGCVRRTVYADVVWKFACIRKWWESRRCTAWGETEILKVLNLFAFPPESWLTSAIQMLLCTAVGRRRPFIFTAKIQSVAPSHSHWYPSVDPLRDIRAFCLIQLNVPVHQSLIIWHPIR